MPGGSSLDVLAVGHAIVDVLTHCDDDLVAAVGLDRGVMTLVDADRSGAIYAAMGPGVETSGGSAANTAAGVASLGGRAAFAGRVADDQFGAVFTHDIRSIGVTFEPGPPESGGPETARCLVLVTPDAQRTMATHLGVAGELAPGDVDDALSAVALVTYLEGYLVGGPGQAALESAAAAAHRAGRKVALTLSDPFWVELHRDIFLQLLEDLEVDILFANEAEALSISRADGMHEAMQWLRRLAKLVTVTLGPRGALVAGPAGAVDNVLARPVEHVVDTTGAGDLYAAGFLFGLTRDLPLVSCAELGCLAAAEIITHDGARPADPLHGLLGPRLTHQGAT